MEINDREYLIKLAEKNVCEGIIEEPRFFYDSIGVDNTGLVTPGNEDVFRNGEQFPVRLTHMVAAIRGEELASPVALVNERMIQRTGLRLTFHDQYYMNREFVPIPLWVNKVVAAGDTVTTAVASWFFARPLILSTRDSLRVSVALEDTPTVDRRVVVCFTGVGIQSKRPYFFSSDVVLTTTASTILSTDRFRNDGAEPIVLTDMTVSCGADNAGLATDDPQGDIRRFRVNVRQLGNGTGADWGTGPVGANVLAECPAPLFGVTSGRAAVHEFPEPLLWEPGEGITVETQQVGGTVTANTVLAIGLFGYLSLT